MSIGDYIVYSVPGSQTSPTRYITHTQLLPAGYIGAHIAFPSTFSHSGVGYKQLSVSELMTIFGFSTTQFSLHLTSGSFPVVPVQILHTLLELAYHSSDKIHQLEFEKREAYTELIESNSNQVRSAFGSSAPTYLDQLQLYLPPLWKAHHSTSVTSTKADNAVVDTHMWDTRINSLWPSFTTHVLAILRTVVLGRIFKGLYNEFIQYMACKHKKVWFKFKAEGSYGSIQNFGGGRENWEEI